MRKVLKETKEQHDDFIYNLNRFAGKRHEFKQNHTI